MILDAYKYGSKALQDALKASNLTYDNVEEVVSEVRETVDISNELQDTLGKVDFNEPSYNIHEDELEQELRELLGETANTKSSGEKDIVHNNNICSESIPQKVDISDAELIAMLKGLEVEQKTPGKNISIGASDM